jgi:hypothetical protein
MTSHLLKAMGFWIWGLIAIGLSVTIISVNSRVVSLFRAHESFKAFANIKLGNLKLAQPDLEKALATGAANAEDKTSMTRTLFGIVAATSQFRETIDYGTQMAAVGAATPNDLALIAQSYFQLKDCQNSVVWSDKAVAASRKAGEAPKENLFLFKLQCASNAGDTAAMIPVLTDLIHLDNKSTYWNTLLRIERQEERDDHSLLMLYRIMYATQSMNADTDYIEMAQLLRDAALPGEAQAVLEKAVTLGIVKNESRDRVTRLLEALAARADAERDGWAQWEQAARESTTGEPNVKVGELRYAAGDYPGAIADITAGVEKGQVKHLDEAYVYLGLSQAALRDDAAAEEAFKHLNTIPGVSRHVANLWQLYAETHDNNKIAAP